MMTSENNVALAGSTLVIDSATEACSVALFSNNDLIAGEYRVLGRGHAEALVPMIAALPSKGRATRIAVAVGPGSFTGVRVGLAAARALALVWGAELVGYPTLALLAAMARAEAGPQPIGAAMTGGHGEWFIEGFNADGTSAWPLASQRPADAAANITEELIVGNQAQALVDLRGSGQVLHLLPDARAFSLLPPQMILSDTQPLYGRLPDAKIPTKTVV